MCYTLPMKKPPVTVAPVITPECIQTLCETKFIKVFDIQYAPGKHYYDATRRTKDNLMAVKPGATYRNELPDAVSIVLTLHVADKAPLLCLTKEFRYPAGQFLLGVPAGLIDPADRETATPLETAAKRELFEECGVTFTGTDTISVLNPFLFSTPGMTDESNALLSVELHRDVMPAINQDGAEGSECFSGYQLLTVEDAQRILRQGTDDDGIFYSVYTWAALMYFVSQCG